MNKKTNPKNAPDSRRLLPMLLAVVVVILLGVLVYITTSNKDDEAIVFDNLPNYTDVKAPSWWTG